MIPKRKRAQKKVDYAASIEDRKRLAAYMNKGHINKVTGKKNYTSSEKIMRLFIAGLALLFIITGFYFVFF